MAKKMTLIPPIFIATATVGQIELFTVGVPGIKLI